MFGTLASIALMGFQRRKVLEAEHKAAEYSKRQAEDQYAEMMEHRTQPETCWLCEAKGRA